MSEKKTRSSSSSKRDSSAKPKSNSKPQKPAIRRKPKCRDLKQKYDDEYVTTVLVKTKNEDELECKVCPPGTIISYKNHRRHIIDTTLHLNRIKSQDQENHDKLVVKMKAKIKAKEKKSDPVILSDKGYLEFLALCMKTRLSFKQISELGKGLKAMGEKKLKFIDSHAFTEEEISGVSRCFGDSILAELKEDLTNNKYSICIDNSTITGKTISIIEARYLKTDILNKIKTTHIENKIIGIKYLEDSSTGETMHNILKEKLLDFSPEIKNNLVGLAHDLASSLASEDKGLIKHLRDDLGRYVFDLKDICHSLNLVIKNSLDVLPEELTAFIDDIHSHFSKSPQRTSMLNQIQAKDDLSVLSLSHYCKTRWLSIGHSLKRLLDIWDPVTKYLDLAKKRNNHNDNLSPKEIEKKNQKLDLFLSLMTNNIFKTKIIFLSSVIDKLNQKNINFQKQCLEIQELPRQIINCAKDISNLFILSKFVPKEIHHLTDSPWEKNPDMLRTDNDFLNIIIKELNTELKIINGIQQKEDQKIIIDFCRDYLKKIVELLMKYLPLNSKVVKALDVVNIPVDGDDFKNKIFAINDKFKIYPSDEENKITKEINTLLDEDLTWARMKASTSSLYLLDIIENSHPKAFPRLSTFLNLIHSLPTTSANVEQSFSIMKLFKSDLRNQLKEETLQSLMLIHQKYQYQPIIITDDIYDKYVTMKKDLNERKSAGQDIQENGPVKRLHHESGLPPSENISNAEKKTKLSNQNDSESKETK